MNTRDIPSYVQREAWDGFIEMRKEIKRPLVNSRAINRLIHRLEELHAKGHDVNGCLDQSTFRNWQDVYPMKEDPIPNLKRETYQPETRTPEQRAKDEAARDAVMSKLLPSLRRVS